MLKQVTHINLWVHDQDEALAFFTDKLGFEVREDVTLEQFNNLRWLTVGPAREPDLNFILSLPGPPAIDEQSAEQLTALVARGAVSGGGSVVFARGDVQAAHEDPSGPGGGFP